MEDWEISIKDYFKGYDSKKIRYGVFGKKDYSKVIVILQGRAEYFEKYHHIVRHFVEKGFLAVLMDWRGQGGSCRELLDKDKGHVNDFLDYQKDLSFFLKKISNFIKPGDQVYGLSHSMGSHNLMRYLIENKNSIFKKIVFSSPMVEIRTFPLSQSLAKLYVNTFVKSGLGDSYLVGTGKYKEIKFKNNNLTSNKRKFFENIFYLRKNKDHAIGGPTNSWVFNAFLSMDYLKKNISKIDPEVKTKIIYGSKESVVKIEVLKKISKFMSEPSLEIKNARHELMMESPELLEIFFQSVDKFFGIK
ncbi:MAG: alpha/beta hydrolase [Desulforegulaceae bacterium]|nr:alpha/beta hydrolase [Desulforegulaceae bacterium]